MIKKPLLLSLSLLCTIGNATNNEQQEKLERELQKITEQIAERKKDFIVKCNIVNELSKEIAHNLMPLSKTGDASFQLAHALHTFAIMQAMRSFCSKFVPVRLLQKKDILTRQLEELKAQKITENTQIADESKTVVPPAIP